MYLCMNKFIFFINVGWIFWKKERNEDVFEKKKLWMDIIIFFVVWFELCNIGLRYIYIFIMIISMY